MTLSSSLTSSSSSQSSSVLVFPPSKQASQGACLRGLRRRPLPPPPPPPPPLPPPLLPVSATVYGYSYSLVLLQSVAAYSEGKTAALLLYAYSCVSLYLGLLIQFYEEKAQSGFCSAVLVLVMCTYT